ncbi:MAG TPA: hypothetical protein VL974_13160 [Magnetospirillum sp.]|jgi:hypothetical protein|nr:hypothetical protein [Magnetospirillum sp.]
MKVRLLDLDGSVMGQPVLKDLARAGLAQTIDLRADGDALRLWARRSDMIAFARRLTEEDEPPGQGATVTFMGSGDYHHLTAPLVARVPGPVSVVHFDNHPDWSKWPPAYHCGSWVNRVLDMPHVAKVVTIGPTSDAVTWPQFKGANLKALNDPRFELHPWRFAPSRVLGRGKVRWRNLAGADWTDFVDDLVKRLPTEAVYLTIDKDVLHPDEAVTNWNQGHMRVDHLLSMIRALAEAKRIVGVDVCGEFAKPHFPNPAKRLLARFDQPRPPRHPDLTPNGSANRRILESLAEAGV